LRPASDFRTILIIGIHRGLEVRIGRAEVEKAVCSRASGLTQVSRDAPSRASKVRFG
jgi:hypothetical protein